MSRSQKRTPYRLQQPNRQCHLMQDHRITENHQPKPVIEGRARTKSVSGRMKEPSKFISFIKHIHEPIDNIICVFMITQINYSYLNK
jgi:hypothetical protein